MILTQGNFEEYLVATFGKEIRNVIYKGMFAIQHENGICTHGQLAEK